MIDISCHVTQYAGPNRNDSSNRGRQKPNGTDRINDREWFIYLEQGRIFVDAWSFGCCFDDSCVSLLEEAQSKGNKHCWLDKRVLASLGCCFLASP